MSSYIQMEWEKTYKKYIIYINIHYGQVITGGFGFRHCVITTKKVNNKVITIDEILNFERKQKLERILNG